MHGTQHISYLAFYFEHLKHVPYRPKKLRPMKIYVQRKLRAVWKIYLKKGSDKFSVTHVQKFTVLIWAKFEGGKKTLSFFFKKDIF